MSNYEFERIFPKISHDDTRPRLGQLLEWGKRLRGFCEDCKHIADLDLRKLVEGLGADYPVFDLGGRMRCSACGSRNTKPRIWD